MDARRVDGFARAMATGASRRRLLRGLGAAGLLALAGGRRAGAAPPERWEEPVDFTFPLPGLCTDFEVLGYNTGTVRGTTFLDREGNPVREVAHIRVQGKFENLETGKSVPFVIRQNDHVTFNPDGSVTVAITGIQGKTSPPAGASVGRLVLTFPAGGGEPTVDFQAGNDNAEEFFATDGILCQMLA